MKAVVLEGGNGVADFSLAELPVPQPGADEVRIRVRAVGFNPADYQFRTAAPLAAMPVVLGREVAGTIDAVGRDVAGLSLGDAVYAYLPQRQGGYAEHVVVHAAFVARKPANLTFDQAAAIPVAALTAYQCLEAAVQPRQPILITGASGGVGSMAVQIARWLGASTVVASAGSERSAVYLNQHLGVPSHQVVRYDQHSASSFVHAALQCIGDRGYPVVLDCAGGAMTSAACRLVDFGGQVISIVQGPAPEDPVTGDADQDHLFSKSARFHFMLLYGRAAHGDASTWRIYRRHLSIVATLIRHGHLHGPKTTVLGPLAAETVQQAHRLLEDGHVQGKLVMTAG